MNQIQGALLFLLFLVTFFNTVLFFASLKVYTEIFKEWKQRERKP